MNLGDALRAASVTADTFVATFVLSLLPADNGFWDVLEHPSTAHDRVAIADLGTPDTAPAMLRPDLHRTHRARRRRSRATPVEAPRRLRCRPHPSRPSSAATSTSPPVRATVND